MKPYYTDDLVTLYHGDAREAALVEGVVMTDPPYNVGYHYRTYDDRLPEAEYLDLLRLSCRAPSVVILPGADVRHRRGSRCTAV